MVNTTVYLYAPFPFISTSEQVTVDSESEEPESCMTGIGLHLSFSPLNIISEAIRHLQLYHSCGLIAFQVLLFLHRPDLELNNPSSLSSSHKNSILTCYLLNSSDLPGVQQINGVHTKYLSGLQTKTAPSSAQMLSFTHLIHAAPEKH